MSANAKTPSADYSAEGVFSYIQRYLNVFPAMRAALRGIGVKVILRVGFGECKLSEPIRLGTEFLPYFRAA